MFQKAIGNTGIIVTKKIEDKEAIKLIDSVATKLVESYPNSKLIYMNIFKTLLDTPMYYAKIPEGISKVNYYYKDSSIIFKEGMDLSIIDEYMLHEFIHKLQEKRDRHGNIVRIGICEFNLIKIKGTGLNEGAIQYIISNVIDNSDKTIDVNGIEIISKSTYYPLLSNIINQLAVLLGEDELIDSTINGNEDFKFKIIDNIGFVEYNKIEKNMNLLLQNIAKKELDETIKKIYFDTQDLIYQAYFNNHIKRIENEQEIKETKNLFNTYSMITGKASDYVNFKKYEEVFLNTLKCKEQEIYNKKLPIDLRNNKIYSIIRKIKRLFKNSTNESYK